MFGDADADADDDDRAPAAKKKKKSVNHLAVLQEASFVALFV